MTDAQTLLEFQQRLRARHGVKFTAGEVLFRDGDVAREAYLLVTGRIRLIKRIGGVERGLRVLRPGDLFGESALLSGVPRNSTALAMDDGSALAFDQATLQEVLFGHPDVGARTLHQLVRRLREAEDKIEIFLLRDAQSKIVVSLIKLAQAAAGGAPSGSVTFAISPMELSTHVGLDVDTVKRNVSDLRESGYVRIVDERVQIPDLQALMELYGLMGVRDQIIGVP